MCTLLRVPLTFYLVCPHIAVLLSHVWYLSGYLIDSLKHVLIDFAPGPRPSVYKDPVTWRWEEGHIIAKDADWMSEFDFVSIAGGKGSDHTDKASKRKFFDTYKVQVRRDERERERERERHPIVMRVRVYAVLVVSSCHPCLNVPSQQIGSLIAH